MILEKKNQTAIHNVLIKDLQHRLFKQYNSKTDKFIQSDEDYDNNLSMLVDWILKCETLNDVNELVISNQDLFDDYDSIGICTLDGTMNYLFKLLR